MMLEEIKRVISQNNTISEEVKANLLSLIEVFIQKFPDVKLDNLLKNLETLRIKKMGKYLSDENLCYKGEENTLYINYSKITENDDIKHLMMFELLNIITYNGSFSGFNENNFLKALNIGFTEILTNNLVGNESDVAYHDDEVVATNLLSSIVGYETLLKAYFTNDARLVLTSIVNDRGINK